MLQLVSVLIVAIFLHQATAESTGPTRCEACRLFSVELERELEKQSQLNAERDQKEGKANPDANRNHLDQALQQVCANMYSYEIQTDDKTALRYKRNAEKNLQSVSKLLSQMGKLLNRAGLQHDMENIIDPNGDLKKLARQCQEFVTKHTDDVKLWYSNQPENSNLSQFLCSERAVKDDTSCLSLQLLDADKEKKAKKQEAEKSDKKQSAGKTEEKSEGEKGSQQEDPKEEEGEVKLEHIEL